MVSTSVTSQRFGPESVMSKNHVQINVMCVTIKFPSPAYIMQPRPMIYKFMSSTPTMLSCKRLLLKWIKLIYSVEINLSVWPSYVLPWNCPSCILCREYIYCQCWPWSNRSRSFGQICYHLANFVQIWYSGQAYRKYELCQFWVTFIERVRVIWGDLWEILYGW
jgi:hypothetical protein